MCSPLKNVLRERNVLYPFSFYCKNVTLSNANLPYLVVSIVACGVEAKIFRGVDQRLSTAKCLVSYVHMQIRKTLHNAVAHYQPGTSRWRWQRRDV